MKSQLSEKRLSPYRLISLLIILVISIAAVFGMSLRRELLLDEIYVLISISLAAFAIFAISLFKKRLRGDIYSGTSYIILTVSMSACWALVFFSDRFSAFFAPMMLLPLVSMIVLDGTMGLSFSLFLCCVLGIIGDFSLYAFYCYCVQVVIGAIIADFRKHNAGEYIVSLSIAAACIQAVTSLSFYYFSHLDIPEDLFKTEAVNVGAVFLYSLIFFEPLVRLNMRERKISYERILDDEYPMLNDLRRFSKAQYDHAKRVSWLSGVCAKEIDADQLAVMAGGLYYRYGETVGEPVVENGVKAAYMHGFPTEVISIMEEYGGKQKKPSTRESAIVHMVDALVARIESYKDERLNSDWNQDMLIYQVTNDFSQQGMYDESGLSMNQFLKIRNRLLKENIA